MRRSITHRPSQGDAEASQTFQGCQQRESLWRRPCDDGTRDEYSRPAPSPPPCTLPQATEVQHTKSCEVTKAQPLTFGKWTYQNSTNVILLLWSTHSGPGKHLLEHGKSHQNPQHRHHDCENQVGFQAWSFIKGTPPLNIWPLGSVRAAFLAVTQYLPTLSSENLFASNGISN